MWDAFLDRTCQSCVVFSSTGSHYRRKTDLFSVEYLNYIHKDVLSYLDHYPMKNSRPKPNKKVNPRSNRIKRQEDERKTAKQVPVYFKVDVKAKEDHKKRPETSHLCKGTAYCKCDGSCKKDRVSEPHKISKNFLSDKAKEKAKNSKPLAQFKKDIYTAPKNAQSGVKTPSVLSARKEDLSSSKRNSKNLAYNKNESFSNEVKVTAEPSREVICTKTFVKNLDCNITSNTRQLAKNGKYSDSKEDVPQIYKFRVRKEPISDMRRKPKLPFSTSSIPKYIREKIFKYGEKGSGVRTRSGESQDFYNLRDECLDSGTLFEDPEFPASNSSLFFSQRPDRYYEWKRPGEIVDDPQFFVEGFSRFDVQQGELGDCWLLAAAANLTLYRRLFFQIVPDDQCFDEKYAGIFHFRFWQYGRWIDVVIDDRLPTYRGQLIFLHSTEENEFWSALLEKAYAKLHGSYEALKGGSTCEAMEDFTGGVTEMYEMEASPPNLFQIVLKAYERSSLMGCSIEPDPNVVEAQTPEGLIRGHAYSITRVQYVDIQTPNVTGKIPLLRLRNPWGNESEWNGPWSDGAPEWRFISESEKEELGLTFDNDGEFWMSFKDFQKQFSRLEICNLNPDSLSDEELRDGNKKKWEMSVFEGEWVRGVTAGGCRNFIDSFWHNPQYRITLIEVDEGDDDGQCTLIVALMQKNRRQIRSTGVDLLTIGFAIYHLPYPDRVPKPLDLNFFKYNASVARSPSFINLREVSCRFKLPPGTYCIVPSTFDPNEEGEFLLRVFSENKNVMEENDESLGYGEMDEKILDELLHVAVNMNNYFSHPVSKCKVSQEPTPEEKEETDKVYEFFLKLAGEDQEVDWMELKEILDYSMKTELHLEGFSKDICRSMVAMLDADRSGKLGYQEFKNLWISLRNWKNVWTMYDTDKSGTFSGFELREALNSAGYRLNNRVLNVLMHRYGNRRGQINFDDFMMCAIKLKTMMDIFKEKDAAENNIASFSLEEWLENTLYT